VAAILHKLRVPDRESAIRLLEGDDAEQPSVEAHGGLLPRLFGLS
jgi:hypothetical protein